MIYIKEMKQELLRLMFIKSDSEWGPQPIICRWCGCWLEWGDDLSKGKPEEKHSIDCFAVRFLGRPSK